MPGAWTGIVPTRRVRLSCSPRPDRRLGTLPARAGSAPVSTSSWIGAGAPLGEPSLGNMLAESRQYLFVAPHLMYVPAAVIVPAVIAANLVGDGLGGRPDLDRRGVRR